MRGPTGGRHCCPRREWIPYMYGSIHSNGGPVTRQGLRRGVSNSEAAIRLLSHTSRAAPFMDGGLISRLLANFSPGYKNPEQISKSLQIVISHCMPYSGSQNRPSSESDPGQERFPGGRGKPRREHEIVASLDPKAVDLLWRSPEPGRTLGASATVAQLDERVLPDAKANGEKSPGANINPTNQWVRITCRRPRRISPGSGEAAAWRVPMTPAVRSNKQIPGRARPPASGPDPLWSGSRRRFGTILRHGIRRSAGVAGYRMVPERPGFGWEAWRAGENLRRVSNWTKIFD
jgi:hypothetical protein